MTHSGAALHEPIHIAKLLGRGLDRSPDAPALVSLEGALTFAELDLLARQLAAAYLSLGLKPGDRVASLMPNRNALIANYLACFKAGLVATPLNYRYTPAEIDHALAVSQASILLVHAERAGDIDAGIAARLPLGVIVYGGVAGSARSFERLVKTAPAKVEMPAADANEPAAIFFTSGSTGPAKGVTHSVGSLGAVFSSAVEGYRLGPDDVMMPASSCSHLGGFTFAMAALAAGACLAMPRNFDHTELGPLMRQARPTLMSMLPAALFHLIREHDTVAEDFSSVRFCRCGGDKVPLELDAEFMALTGQPVREGYGMTETGIAANNPRGGADKFGSIGIPNPGFMFSIRDAGGREVAAGEEGRAYIGAPSLFSGYWNDPAATAEVLRDGWIDTGDVMRVDEDGYLWFAGRQKQIIVHDSSNIAPQEVEDALLAHDAVANAGVVGVRDPLHGENVRAYVELKRDAARPKVAELIEFARARIGYKAPEDIVFIDAMPLNATGKVDRAKLKALAADQAGVL